jgi:hypothetical protein
MYTRISTAGADNLYRLSRDARQCLFDQALDRA